MTAEELMNIDDDSHRHELIKGELLTMPLPKPVHGQVTANLLMLVGQYVKANRLGRVYSESGYHIESDPDTVLGPDVSFVTQDRIDDAVEGYYQGSPDLVIEVLSPGDRRGRVEHKLCLWLESGAKSVWLVNPRRRTVEVCKLNGDRKLFHDTDELIDDIVPSFRVAVSEIFD